MKFAAVTVVLAFAVECTARVGQYPYGTPAGHLFKKRHTTLEDEMTWSDKKHARDEKLFQILSRESGDRLFSDASSNEISEDINGDRRPLFAKRDMEYPQRRLKKSQPKRKSKAKNEFFGKRASEKIFRTLFNEAKSNEISEDTNGDQRPLFAKRDMEYPQRRLKSKPKCKSKNESKCKEGTCQHIATAYCSGTVCKQHSKLRCKDAGVCEFVADQKCTKHHC